MQYNLTDNDKAIIALTSQTKLTYTKLVKVIDTLKENVSLIFSGKIDSILKDVLTQKEISEINYIDERILKNYIKELEERSIEVVTILSKIYPKMLKEISSPPVILYAKGDLDLLSHNKTLAVVGTRRCTNYGEDVTKSFVRSLAKEDICIISGLADGIDSIAHEATLYSKGKTIAVMGSGFNHVYPTCNLGLAKKIVAKGGLILTEYQLDEKPQSYHFPARNRIVAGLSKGVLVIEAPARSGALITKEYALDFNREIFVVPGRITDNASAGSNEILKTCQGSIVLSYEDILEFYGTKSSYNEDKVIEQLSMEEEIVFTCVKDEEKHYEEILIETGLQSNKLNIILTKLELKNIIRKLPGNMYTRAVI